MEQLEDSQERQVYTAVLELAWRVPRVDIILVYHLLAKYMCTSRFRYECSINADNEKYLNIPHMPM